MLNSLQEHIHKIYVMFCCMKRVLVSLGYSSFQIECTHIHIRLCDMYVYAEEVKMFRKILFIS